MEVEILVTRLMTTSTVVLESVMFSPPTAAVSRLARRSEEGVPAMALRSSDRTEVMP